MNKKAINFIDKTWKENKLPFPIKEQWAEIMQQYADEQIRNNKQ